MHHTASKPQIGAINDRYVPDVGVGDRAAVCVVVVHPATIYGVWGVNILIILSCDI